MDGFSLETLLTIVGIIIAVFIGIFFGFFFRWRARADGYEKEIKDLKERGTGKDVSLGLQRIAKIKDQEVKNIFERKYNSWDHGDVELSAYEIATLWSRMFAEQNIIYFRTTSLISPSLWDDPFMRRYEGNQRANIDYFNNLKEKERWQYDEMIKSIIPYEELRLPNFERIFIIKKDQLESTVLARLIEIICSQSEYMDVAVAYEGRILPDNKEDFGITLSKDGDALLYDLIPDVGGDSLLGGHIKLDEGKRDESINKYRSIKANSESIPRRAQFKDVSNILNNICKGQIDLDELSKAMDELSRAKEEQERQREGFHKCIGCFLESEKTIEKNSWHTFIPARKRWYEMIDAENRRVRDYVLKNKPRRILEVGCGPGRLIGIIEQIGFENFEEIVGIEADRQMYNYAYKRWQNNNKIEIFNMRVEKRLPYEDDHFDFCINASNIVGWQENEGQWLEEMLRCSKVVFFTLYKKGIDKERLEMYETRGHRPSEAGVHIGEDGQIILGDCAVIPNVISRAYTPEQVRGLCSKVSSKYEVQFDIDSTSNELLYICFIHKK